MYSVKPKKATRNLFHFSQNTNNDNNIIVTFIKKEKETIIVIALRAIACSKWCGRHTTPFHRNLSVAEWCTVVWLVLRTFFLRRWTCFSWSDKSVFIHYWRQTRLTTNKYESIAAQKLKVNLKINIYMSMWWIFLFRFVGSLNVLFNFRILNMFAIYSISLFVCLFVCCTLPIKEGLSYNDGWFSMIIEFLSHFFPAVYCSQLWVHASISIKTSDKLYISKQIEKFVEE